MMRAWMSTLRVTSTEVSLLVRDQEAGDRLKARLPTRPRHPRALLTLLEGVALWQGERLHVALSAASSSAAWLGSDLFGDELWPRAAPITSAPSLLDIGLVGRPRPSCAY